MMRSIIIRIEKKNGHASRTVSKGFQILYGRGQNWIRLISEMKIDGCPFFTREKVFFFLVFRTQI